MALAWGHPAQPRATTWGAGTRRGQALRALSKQYLEGNSNLNRDWIPCGPNRAATTKMTGITSAGEDVEKWALSRRRREPQRCGGRRKGQTWIPRDRRVCC